MDEAEAAVAMASLEMQSKVIMNSLDVLKYIVQAVSRVMEAVLPPVGEESDGPSLSVGDLDNINEVLASFEKVMDHIETQVDGAVAEEEAESDSGTPVATEQTEGSSEETEPPSPEQDPTPA